MKTKRLAIAAVGLAAVFAGSALGAPQHGKTLMIRHQVRGCHAWSFDNLHWRATQAITIVRGTRLTVVDNDVMPHTLAQLTGPKAQLISPVMSKVGARAQITFTAKGVYTLGTKAGEDYPRMAGMKTAGEDNVLRLVVTVK
jgi:plastocyanin